MGKAILEPNSPPGNPHAGYWPTARPAAETAHPVDERIRPRRGTGARPHLRLSTSPRPRGRPTPRSGLLLLVIRTTMPKSRSRTGLRVPIVGDVLDTACLDSANLVGWLSSGWRRTGYRHWVVHAVLPLVAGLTRGAAIPSVIERPTHGADATRRFVSMCRRPRAALLARRACNLGMSRRGPAR
jgi:hypothetical protein